MVKSFSPQRPQSSPKGLVTSVHSRGAWLGLGEGGPGGGSGVSGLFTDFSEDSVGSGLPTGWTNRWASASWSVEDFAGYRAVKESGGSDGRVFASWDAVTESSEDPISDVEIVALVQISGSAVSGVNQQNALYLRCGTEAEGGYTLRLSDRSALELVGYTPSFSMLSSASFSHVRDKWYYLKFRAEGEELKGKVWAQEDPEPEGWLVSTTHSHRMDGRVGIGRFSTHSIIRHYTHIGVGLNGEPAPLDI